MLENKAREEGPGEGGKKASGADAEDEGSTEEGTCREKSSIRTVISHLRDKMSLQHHVSFWPRMRKNNQEGLLERGGIVDGNENGKGVAKAV